MVNTRRTNFPPDGDVSNVKDSASESGNGGVNGSTLIQMTQDQLVQLIQAAVQAVVPHQEGTRVGSHHGNQFAKRNKDFISLGGTTFSGETGVIDAMKWIMQCDSLFKVMALSPVEQRELAAHQLTGSALYWWDDIRKGMDPNVFDEMTWVDFKGLFEKRFVPEAIKAQLVEEFNQLVQGGRTVSEYRARFDELSVYAPHLIEGSMKNEKFIRGLRPEIQRVVLSVMSQPFSVIYDLSLRIEQVDNEDKAFKHMSYGPIRGHVGANRGGWYRPYGSTQNFNDGFRQGPYGQPMHMPTNPSSFQAMPVPAQYPDSAAGGGQGTKVKLCYRCGDPNHFVKNCPCHQNNGRKKYKDQGSDQPTVTPILREELMYRSQFIGKINGNGN
ncbi:hypothetical protein ACHQM5_020352 [Ranunculus cassubicifolius]